MIVLIIVASVLPSISIINLKTKPKNTTRSENVKENAVKNINYSFYITYPLTTENLDLIFKDKIHELAHPQY
jgi:hypothetical protein